MKKQNKNVPKTDQNFAKYPPKWKNRSRTPKIPPEKIEYNGQKLTYLKKKNMFLAQKLTELEHF